MQVNIINYKWAGKKFFFKIKTECEECNLATAILKGMMNKEFKAKSVSFQIKPWLDNIFYCLFRGAWHAPMIFVNGKKFWQYSKKKPMFSQRELAAYVNELLQQ